MSQEVHTERPVVPAYLPAAQFKQDVAVLEVEYLPTAHDEQAVAPIKAKCCLKSRNISEHKTHKKQ